MTELELVIENSPRLRPTTKRNYLRAVRRFLDFAGTHPRNWSGANVENWRDSISRGLKPQTVNAYLAALRYASRRLAQRHQNPQLDFAGYAEMLQADQAKTPRVLTHEEGAALVTACEGEKPNDLRDNAIAILGLRTGLRREGICGIHFNDFNGNSVQVTLKGGRRHWIVLDEEVVGAIGSWAKWLYEQGIRGGRVFRSVSKPQLDGTVTVRESLSTDGLYHAMKGRAEKAGIKGFHPHVFRHTFVSWCQQAGVPVHRIAGVTGHKSTGMLDTYTTDLDPEPVGGLLPSLKKKK
jgi:integrase